MTINPSVGNLSIFQKHLQNLIPKEETEQPQVQTQAPQKNDEVKFQEKEKIEHKAFGQGIKSINELIGALQSSEIALHKISKEGSNLSSLVSAYNDASIDGNQREEIAKEAKASRDNIAQIIENAKFMGNSLFGSELTTKSSDGKNIGISLEKPNLNDILVLDSEKIDSFNSSISAKRDEIKSSLKEISKQLSQKSEVAQSDRPSYDFNKFDADVFKNLHKKG